MFELSFSAVSVPDVLAFMWFVFCWGGYGFVADRIQYKRREMAQVAHGLRVKWMLRMLNNENRMPDITIVVAHIRSGSLFVSTSLLITAGVVALLGNVSRVRQVLSELSFAANPTTFSVEIKTFLLLAVFVYAFFKFAWCLRQYNYSLVLIGAAPKTEQLENHAAAVGYAERVARVLSRAAMTFNRGLRSYYFGLAMLMWFVQPILFAAGSVIVLMVLYRRDFHSNTLDALAGDVNSSGHVGV